VHRIDHHRTRRHARPAHQPALLPKPPRPALLLSSVAIAAITITLPYSPLPGPLGLTAGPAWILAALAGLTAFYVITNEGPNIASHLTTRSTNPASAVASDELIAQHTTRPAAISSVEGVGVLGEPFGLASGVGEDQPVFHGDVGVDLGETGDDLLGWLAGDLRPRCRDPLDQFLLPVQGPSLPDRQ
jgi:hypothetical protein